MQGIQPYDSLSKSISKSVFSDTIHKGVNYVETIGRDVTEGMKRVEKQVEQVSNGMKQLISVLDTLLPNLLKDVDIKNKNWTQVSSQIVRNIDDKVIFLSQAVKDPEIRRAMQRAIRIYGKVFKEVHRLDEPLIQEMTDKIWETIQTIGEKSARNTTNALIQSGMAVIAEIPGIGGAVDLVIAFGKWYNTASGIIAPSILQIQDTTHKTIQIGKDGMAVAHKYDTDIRNVKKELNDAVEQFQSKRSMGQTGGKRRRNAKKTAKRLAKSISTFTRYKHS
jgi:DNA-binding ferritin-like protein